MCRPPPITPPLRQSTFCIQAYVQEGKAIQDWLDGQLQEVLGEKRANLFQGYAQTELHRDFSGFGKLGRTITFVACMNNQGKMESYFLERNSSGSASGTRCAPGELPPRWAHLLKKD